MICLDHLSFRYPGPFPDAVHDVSTVIPPGIHLLLGENGAGKTTLLRLIAGLTVPGSGECLVDGENSCHRVPSVMRKIFFLPDEMMIPTRTIREFAAIHSRYYPGYDETVFNDNLAAFCLSGDEDVASLSLGMRHKTMLAYVIALGTDVLLLDEPANGLDITSKKTLRAILAKNIREDQTVIVSTHTVADLRELYDGLIMLSHGRLLLCRSTWEISCRINCIATPIPPVERIFMDQEAGMFLSIVRNETGEPGDLNYNLLNSALLSPKRDELLSIINSEINNE